MWLKSDTNAACASLSHLSVDVNIYYSHAMDDSSNAMAIISRTTNPVFHVTTIDCAHPSCLFLLMLSFNTNRQRWAEPLAVILEYSPPHDGHRIVFVPLLWWIIAHPLVECLHNPQFVRYYISDGLSERTDRTHSHFVRTDFVNPVGMEYEIM